MIAHGQQQRCFVPRRTSRRATAATPSTPQMPETLAADVSSPPSGPSVDASALDVMAAFAVEEGEEQAGAGQQDDHYVVEKILKSRSRDGHTEFFVRWEDYGPEDDSWVAADDVGIGPISRFYNWGELERVADRFKLTDHPKTAQAQPDWRRKKPLTEKRHKKPVFTSRLTPDSEEKEENRGWKVKQLTHQRHLDFKSVNVDYNPGLRVHPANGAPPGSWADLWVPREVWALESTQSNIYAQQKIEAKMESGKDLDVVDLAFARHNGFSPDSCKLFHAIQMLLHGDHHIAYDASHVWGSDPCRNFGGWVKDRISRHCYHAHCRYLHFEDNEEITAEIADPAIKTRKLRELLQSVLRENVQPPCDLAVDETSLDTESRKVYNRQRLRFKPSCNEGVLYDMVSCSQTGYPFGYEEGQSDPEGDFSLTSVVGRLTDRVCKQRDSPTHMHVYTDSRYTSPELCQQSLKKKVYITGTVDSRRVGLPKNEIQAILAHGLAWCEWTVLSKDGMELVIWCDRSICMFLTTGFASTLLGSVVRKEESMGEWTRLICPYVIQVYNDCYDGVDHTNQILKSVSASTHVRVLRHPRKQASFFKDLSITAAYIMYRVHNMAQCGADHKAAEKFFNKCSKADFCNSILHHWGDSISFKGCTQGTPLRLLSIVANSGSVSEKSNRLAHSTIDKCNAPTMPMQSVGGGIRRKRKQSRPPGRPKSKKQDQKVVKHVHVISASNSNPDSEVPMEDQQKHKLRNMYAPPHNMKGGRGCAVCMSGVGFYSTNGKPFKKQTGWRCIECKRYMCAECYFLYKKHAGFKVLTYE